MIDTPLSERLHVVLAGPRNAGKSSLMNTLFGREVSLVSDMPGTTTDPVTRAFEIPGVGPIAFTDTPGIDDQGNLGLERVRLAQERANRADILLFVTPAHRKPEKAEIQLFQQWFPVDRLSATKPAFLVLTHADSGLHPAKKQWADQHGALKTDIISNSGFSAVIAALASAKAPPETAVLDGIVREGQLVLLVTPIDLAAPTGRLIAPQVQTIRDALDKDAAVLIVKERELRHTYTSLGMQPALVITDSQAFSKVAADVAPDQLLTSFSILFARKKGDLMQFIDGLHALSRIKESPRVMILESCAHHRQADDIGTVKIPRLFRQLVRDDVQFDFERGMPDTKTLSGYDLVVHCGGCRLTRTAMCGRLDQLERAKVPVVNYGMFLAWVNGLMPRAIAPFPDAMEKWQSMFGH